MPSTDSSPNFALLTECDLRDLSTVTLYRRLLTTISITMADVVYLDIIDFLNGYSANQTIADNANFYATTAPSGTAGDWVIGIDESDKIYVQADDPFDIDYNAGTDYLGIGSTTVSAVASGSKYVATMPNDWVRGRVLGPWSFNLTPDTESGFTVTIDGEYQETPAQRVTQMTLMLPSRSHI